MRIKNILKKGGQTKFCAEIMCFADGEFAYVTRELYDVVLYAIARVKL